ILLPPTPLPGSLKNPPLLHCPIVKSIARCGVVPMIRVLEDHVGELIVTNVKRWIGSLTTPRSHKRAHRAMSDQPRMVIRGFVRPTAWIDASRHCVSQRRHDANGHREDHAWPDSTPVSRPRSSAASADR